MKKLICLIALLGVIAVTATACDVLSVKTDNTPTAAVTEQAQPATQAPEPETEAPKETQAPETQAPKETDPPQSDNADSEKEELVSNEWRLTKVIDADQQEFAPQVYYGSVIRQSGAYIEFHEDDTFECVLGVCGCAGTYRIENGVVLLHITKIYKSFDSSEAAGDDKTLVWDHEDTITLSFSNVTNVFTKQ